MAFIACTGMHSDKWTPLTGWHTQGSRQVPQVPARHALLVYRSMLLHPFCMT